MLSYTQNSYSHGGPTLDDLYKWNFYPIPAWKFPPGFISGPGWNVPSIACLTCHRVSLPRVWTRVHIQPGMMLCISEPQLRLMICNIKTNAIGTTTWRWVSTQHQPFWFLYVGYAKLDGKAITNSRHIRHIYWQKCFCWYSVHHTNVRTYGPSTDCLSAK